MMKSNKFDFFLKVKILLNPIQKYYKCHSLSITLLKIQPFFFNEFSLLFS